METDSYEEDSANGYMWEGTKIPFLELHQLIAQNQYLDIIKLPE